MQVNRELKKLLVASVGDDLQYHFERMSREKNQLILENEVLGRNLAHTAEQLERMSIQCDVWRSKFLASRSVLPRRCSLDHEFDVIGKLVCGELIRGRITIRVFITSTPIERHPHFIYTLYSGTKSRVCTTMEHHPDQSTVLKGMCVNTY